jgi:hypothetical protein
MKAKVANCPDCEIEDVLASLEVVRSFETDWYGRLTYFHCGSCGGDFVQSDHGEIEPAGDSIHACD